MKLDSGQVVSPGSAGHDAECIPVDSTKLKFVKENDKESQNGLRSDFEGSVDSDQLEYEVANVGGWTESGHGHDLAKGCLSDDSEKAVQEYVGAMSPAHPYVKPQSFEDSFFYVDKNIMERELPEVIVYKENTFQVVKDICVDDGLPSQNKFLLDTDVCRKSLSTIPLPEKETSTLSIRGNEDSSAFKSPIEKTDLSHCPDDLVSSQENESQSDSSISSNCKASRPTEDWRDGINEMGTNVVLKDTWSLRDLLSMKHWGTELSWPKSSDNREAREKSPAEMDSHSEPQNDSLEVITLSEPSMAPKAEESDRGAEGVSFIVPADHPTEELEIVHQEVGMEGAALDSEFKELDNSVKEVSHPNELTSCSPYEETGTVALDFESTALASICEDSGPQKSDGEHLEAQNSNVPQSGVPGLSSTHPRYGQGETSFSDAVPFSGLITYTGPIAYSGSLSIRSDSSTTSTRSFAFPVLQSEWNSSPVRMAKADRKRLNRHRRWRRGLLCCKF